MRSEIILLVENIDICRYFYRHTLGLGEPILDSTYMCAFALDDETFLVLEKSSASFMEHAASACRFALHFEDMDSVIERLKSAGENPVEAFTRFNQSAYRISDPEGNIILLI